jgi:hypothetical protein
MLLGVWESVKNEPPHPQVSSHFGSWSPDGPPNFQRVIIGVKTHYIKKFIIPLEKFLEHKFLKWACMTHLDISNTSYDQKKGQKSKWQFDSRPLKVWNRLNFLACKWRAIYRWKALDKGYDFALDFISIESLHVKSWAPKLGKSQLWEFRNSHLGVPGQNDIWVLVPWPCIKYTIKGKVVPSPSLKRGESCEFMFAHGSSMHWSVPTTH